MRKVVKNISKKETSIIYNSKYNYFSDDYNKIINEYPVLTREQEFREFKKIYNKSHYHKEAVRKAFEKIVYSNQRLVVYYAKNYHYKYLTTDFMDLVEYGNVGLIKAVLKFNPFRKLKFSTYAVPCIIRKITDYIGRSHSVIGYKPNSNRKLADMFFPTVVSLDELVEKTNGKFEIKDIGIWKPIDDLKKMERMIAYNEIIQLVSPQEKQLIKYVFENEYPYRKIGKIYNVSGEYIRMKMKNIFKEIRIRMSREYKIYK